MSNKEGKWASGKTGRKTRFSFKKIINFICKPVIYFLLLIIVILIVVIPDFYAKSPIGPYAFKQHANNLPLIDMVTNYSPQYAYKLIGGYGQGGRNYYIFESLTMDVVIPLVMLLFIIASINLIYKQTKLKKHIYKFAIIPFVGFLSDYAENACVITMILNYPEKIKNLAVISNIFTLVKGAFDFMGILIVLLGIIYIGINRCLKTCRTRVGE